MNYLQIEYKGKGCRISLGDLKGPLTGDNNYKILERAAFLAALHTDEELGYYNTAIEWEEQLVEAGLIKSE